MAFVLLVFPTIPAKPTTDYLDQVAPENKRDSGLHGQGSATPDLGDSVQNGVLVNFTCFNHLNVNVRLGFTVCVFSTVTC